MAAKEPRISKLSAGLAIAVAIIIDLTQLGLDFIGIGGVLNPFIITPIVYICFFIWFTFRDIKFSEPKNLTAIFVGSLIEAIPYVDLLPGLTVMVSRIIINSRVEDMAAGGGIIGSIAQKGLAQPGQTKTEPPAAPARQEKEPLSAVQTQARVIDLRNNPPPSEPTNLAGSNIKTITPPPTNIAKPNTDLELAA